MEDENKIRAPICVIMGHVDSGKTSLLDKVRKTVVQAREAGGITQHIGASLFPKETIIELSKDLQTGNFEFKTPGILIIDTPGHEAFMTLRTRGASIADVAIVVVDLTKGFQAQTFESIQTLRRNKVPFVIAANKVDRIGGWEAKKDTPFVKSYSLQNKKIQERFDNEIYAIMGELSHLNFEADRYDKIKNFAKKIAIIPTSATSGEGITDLFLVIAGLTQQYMMNKLTYADGPGKGVILEVKEETGMGTTVNIILYQGNIESKDTIIIAGRKKAITTKIRSMVQPKPLDEIRDPREKFETPKKIWASAGIKISAPNLEEAIPGGAFYVARGGKEVIDRLTKEVEKELSEIQISTSDEGVLIRTDTLGSLEALTTLLKEKGIPIRSADVGDVSRRDIIDVSITARNVPEYGAILAFNVKVSEDAQELAFTEGIEIFSDPIIYRMIDEYLDWMNDLKRKSEANTLADIPRPTKIIHLPQYVFKRNKPMVVGVKIIGGRLNVKDILIDSENQRLGTIHQIKKDNDFIREAIKDEEISVAIRGPTYGRQFKEGQVCYVDLRANHALLLMTKFMKELTPEEQEILKELEMLKKQSGLKFWPFTG
ncbi:MAG: translation initiation factor IF-2 [Candidatus Heimdallarchaeota archaeon]|nr:translation initiation factor IF-2 [Candidatus Heimdallarchaeota archaeon]MDH5644650.1 translation initiation factor IF-2 [Candidatus Heimdallarchaeota archaeon]